MKIFVLTILLFCCSALNAEKSYTTQIAMKDGIKLSADIYLPNSSEAASTVLIRTPYSKEGAHIFANYLQSCGFVVVVQDVRGKYSSEGDFVPFLNEYEDGIRTLDWIEEQKWFNGAIGMWGSSYLGYSALILSESSHASLKSIFAISSWIEGDLINSPGGAFHQMLIIPWLLSEGRSTKSSIKGMDLDEIFRHLPLKEVIPIDTNDKDYQHLKGIDTAANEFNYEQVKIPIMQIGGWYDFASNASLSAYKKCSNAHRSLLLGPWYHNQIYIGSKQMGEYELPLNARIGLDDLMDLACEWFHNTLNWKKTPPEEVKYYVLFENEWKVSSQWPPEEAKRKEFYLVRHQLRDKIEVLKSSSSSSFIYDPMNPNPTIGGANFHFFLDNIGLKEQSESTKREDVLSFESQSFKSKKNFVGEVELELYVTSEGRGTDFTAKLCKVDSSGKLWNLLEGIKRIESTKVLDEIQKIKISLGHSAFQIQRGERLVLQISSSNFPKYNRNPNTGIDPMDATELKPVEQTIYHDIYRPSRLILNQLLHE